MVHSAITKLSIRERLISGIYFALFIFVLPYLAKNFLWPEKITDPQSFFTWFTFLIHELTYILYNLFYYYIYTLESPHFEKYKINNEPWPWKVNKPEWTKLLRRSLGMTFFNQFILVPVVIYLNNKLSGIRVRTDLESLPDSFEILWQFIFSLLVEDFAFYWSHRLLHWDKIYLSIHKIHHEYKNTISIASEYAHPIEFLLGNVLPSNLASIILGSRMHALTLGMWIFMRITSTTDGHSGYEFPISLWCNIPYVNPSSFHNFHHLKFKGNYGSSFRFWDKVCNTLHPDYKNFVQENKIN